MALSSLRLRRTLTAFSALHRSLSASPSISSPNLLHHPYDSAQSLASPLTQFRAPIIQSRAFRSAAMSLLSPRSAYNSNNSGQGDEIGPDTILFEGCDYNHWLIVMDFPKDQKIPPEEMIRTYEETCARGLNISVEEAKKKIYACSTTTYVGFQAVMTEEESEKFHALPGVVFVLPDSYIDPQNKEYGGDKYINGTIIPRPPPVQYGRQTGRYRDRNRYPDQPRYDRQGGPMPNQQGNQPYGNQGPMQGSGRNYGNQQNYPAQQNYGPPGQRERRDRMPVNAQQGRDPYQPGRGGPVPSYQGNYSQGEPGNHQNFPQGDQRNYAPPGQGGYGGDGRNFGSTQGANYGQPVGGYQGQGSHEAYGQGANSGNFGQGTSSNYGQNYPDNQRFSQ